MGDGGAWSTSTGGDRRGSLPARGCAAIVLTVMAVLAVAVLGVGWTMYRGLGLDKRAPDVDFDGPALTTAREEADRRLTTRLDAFAGGGISHPVGDTGREDSCDRGQYNWKIKDDVAVRCSLSLTRVYTFSGEFVPQAHQLVVALESNACAGYVSPYVERAASALRRYEERLGQTFRNFPDGYHLDHITPSPVCETSDRASGRVSIVGWMTLPIVDVHRRSHADDLPAPCFPGRELCDNHALDLDETLGAAPLGDRWAVVVRVTERYWRAGWD